MSDVKKTTTDRYSFRSGAFVFEWEEVDGVRQKYCTFGYVPQQTSTKPQTVTLLTDPKKVLRELEFLMIKARAALGE